MAGAKVQGQVGMDETVIEDAGLEAALEKRHKTRAAAKAVEAKFKDANAVAKQLLDTALPELGVYRVGRFRIERTERPARHVEFDAEAGVRLSIGADSDD